ncbi:outer membrane protein assembly factor BamB [Streptomyces sp. SAI-170]|uniref:serine/threonine-protein kinase n=1 Tax=Streptomyces sp. SAI-170 TaxID=3377729 RepID=UPI003C7CC921
MAPQSNIGIGAEAELPEYAGHYLLESRLGSGGMGVVHLARSTSGMQLAVKVVHAEFARDPEFRGRFRQEVAAARRVSGAFTAPVVDADPEAERPWMATLFIPGPTLAEHVKRNGPMNVEQLRRLMAGLAEALRDIHRVGVVHRDLKPSNVLLAEDGPKVIDFGISRPKDSELRTETGKLIGTPPFMAPEQFRRPREVGPAADIFALGSVMVHAATGRGPFDSDSPYVVAYQVVHDEPDLTDVPGSLAPLVSRCLAKEPEERPTPDELMRELRSLAASYDTQAFIPTQRTADVPKPQPRPASAVGAARKRRGRRTVVGAATLVVLAVSAVVALRVVTDEPKAAETAGTHTASAAVRAWETEPVAGDTTAPQCSYGDGRLLCGQRDVVFALDPADGTLLWRRSIMGSQRSGAPVLSGGLVHPLAEGTEQLEAIDPASGKVRWHHRTPGPSGGMQPAGDTLLHTSPDGTTTAMDGATGENLWSHRVGEGLSSYFVSFRGDPLAYTTTVNEGGFSTVTALVPRTGAVKWEARLEGALELAASQDGSLYFLATDHASGRTSGVVRYTPGAGTEHRVKLSVPRQDAQVGIHGDSIYILSVGGALEALDSATGKRKWQLETSVVRGSAPVADARHVYFTAPDGRLFAVDARNGHLLGQTRPRPSAASDKVPGELPEPLVRDGRVYASAPDGTVFSVPAKDPAAWR